MAITDLQTATAINVVITWLMPSAAPDPRTSRRIDDATAYHALEHLAGEANRKLRGGVTRSRVRQAIDVDAFRLQALSHVHMKGPHS